MGYASRMVVEYLKGTSGEIYFSTIAKECGVSKEFVRMAVKRLSEGGKVRDCSTEQFCGQPCCEWTGG